LRTYFLIERIGDSVIGFTRQVYKTLSPRAYFFCSPERSEGSLGACAPREDSVGDVAQSSLFCRPEPTFFVAPRRQPRGPSALACLGMTWWEAVAPSPLFCHPELPFLSSRAHFFVAPRRQPRGPSALACLGKTSRNAVPNDAMRDAVPSEARGASLSLGRTKNGRSAGQCRGDFFEQPFA
jgi:hypothetical protein